MTISRLDAVVIGGGFFGTSIAHYLRTRRGFGRVLVLDRADGLLSRASLVNQARVHGGYHYPRSFTTAYRSRANLPRFRAEFGAAVFDDFTAVYGITRRNSKVTVTQFRRFCAEIGAPFAEAPADLAALFERRLVERVYVTDEQAFNADVLRSFMTERLHRADVEVRLEAEVTDVAVSGDGVLVRGNRRREPFEVNAAFLFNCTYSRLQQVVSTAPGFGLRHEIAEIVLVEPPPELRGLGVTLMDGPFFSTMPFPARKLHSLTHVRYTPHLRWDENPAIDPYRQLGAYPQDSAVDWMIRDASRYLPALARCRPAGSLFEVKTVLARSEGDDSRPILLERHGAGGLLFSILGGKIDNVYDVLERLDAESFG